MNDVRTQNTYDGYLKINHVLNPTPQRGYTHVFWGSQKFTFTDKLEIAFYNAMANFFMGETYVEQWIGPVD